MKLPRTPFPENNSTMPYQYEPGTIVVGIDLGTTNTVCFVYDGSGYEVIKFGNLTVLPSYVQYKKNGTVVCGEVAKGNYGKRQFWVISNSKRIIGRPYSKEQIKNLSQNCGVPIVDDHGIPKFHLDNIKRDVSATDVASEIIRTVIDAVREKYPGKRIAKVTVTTPAYFDNNQKTATIQAVMSAGFSRDQVDTLNEPTAASICYGLDNDVKKKTILVYDFGGGTFDVSILEIVNGEFIVKTTGGDNALGGVDVDKKFMELILDKYREKYGRDFIDPSMDEGMKARYIRMLQRVAEEHKIELASADNTDINVSVFDHVVAVQLQNGEMDDSESTITITIDDMNRKIKPLVDKTITIMNDVMREKGMTPSDIDHVVLVGGSSNLRLVATTLNSVFGSAKLKQSVNPSECVAKGGCMSIVRPIKLEEITSYSLGSSIVGNRVVWVLPKHAKLPAEYSETFSNATDNITSFSGILIQGQCMNAGTSEPITDSMTKLEPYSYSGVTPMPRGQAKVRETYYMNEQDLLLIDAEDVISGRMLMNKVEFHCRESSQ